MRRSTARLPRRRIGAVLAATLTLTTLPALSANAASPTEPCVNGHIALTYDDGPNPPYTEGVLDALKAKSAPATFFVIGSNAERHPDLLERHRAEGHQIANHTWSHPRLPDLSDGEIVTELQRTNDVVRDITGYDVQVMRPPFGATSSRVQSVVAGMGLAHVLWTYDTNDWRRPGADVIVDRVLSNLHSDMNILMHDGGGNREGTVLAAPRIIDGAREAGYCLGDLDTDGNVMPATNHTIRFSDEDSGIPNYDRGDGVTFLDAVWAEVTFDSHGHFVRTVTSLANSWHDDGLLTRAERQSVMTAAMRSDVGRTS